jgi:hypothetical protein
MVSPGGAHAYTVELTAHEAGPFDAEAELLLESPRGIQSVRLHAVGEARPAEKVP